VLLDGAGSPSRLQWSTEGRTWEWTADNPSSLTSPRDPSYLWHMGHVRELGNHRPIVSSYAYAEVLPCTTCLTEPEHPQEPRQRQAVSGQSLVLPIRHRL
jgi:hypothetical protein